MEQPNWGSFPFALTSIVLGIFLIFSSCYELSHIWRFGGGILRSLFGRTGARLYVGGVGVIALAIGVKEILWSILSTRSILLYPVGFVIAFSTAALIYELRPNQSVRELITAVTKRKSSPRSKKKHDEHVDLPDTIDIDSDVN